MLLMFPPSSEMGLVKVNLNRELLRLSSTLVYFFTRWDIYLFHCIISPVDPPLSLPFTCSHFAMITVASSITPLLVFPTSPSFFQSITSSSFLIFLIYIFSKHIHHKQYQKLNIKNTQTIADIPLKKQTKNLMNKRKWNQTKSNLFRLGALSAMFFTACVRQQIHSYFNLCSCLHRLCHSCIST